MAFTLRWPRRLRLGALRLCALAAALLGALVGCDLPVLSTGQEPLWRSSWSVAEASSPQLELVITPVLSGLVRPVDIRHGGDGSRRLFIAQQHGTVVVVENGALVPGTFLDLRGELTCCGEQGLLSFAPHPRFADNGLVFVYYTGLDGAGTVARYASKGGRADPASKTVILEVAQPGVTHNGGQLQFGPDGFLYLSLGDGVLRRDWEGMNPHSQDLGSLLGKILRLDIDGDAPYRIPPDNPFAQQAGARGEIWALGLRNPWRIAFDKQTGRLFVTDVGYRRWEEINVQEAGQGGLNYGWPAMEGPECRIEPCDTARYTLPALAYGHDAGCSVTGGYVYHGAIARLRGRYLYGDFCSGRLWAAEETPQGWQASELVDSEFNISAFGEDEAGELYLTDFGVGALYKLEERP